MSCPNGRNVVMTPSKNTIWIEHHQAEILTSRSHTDRHMAIRGVADYLTIIQSITWPFAKSEDAIKKLKELDGKTLAAAGVPDFFMGRLI